MAGSARIKSRRCPLFAACCSPHTAISPALIWTFRRTPGWPWICGHLPGFSTSAKRSREIGGGQSTLLELNVADKRKRVAQEVHEPLIGIQYPMLCSRLGDTWQIGATSIREDQLIASGLRFVQWRHASPNIDARKEPKNNPTVRVYQHLEDELTRAGAGNEGILALTTTREGAQNLRNYFEIAWKTANAETAVKVAGATAKHCIVIHGESTFLSGEGRNLDCDQECFTRANVAYSRATNLTILACPLNMQGMPGALPGTCCLPTWCSKH